ncbi:nucleotide-binding universal stress UspA family protein [Pseudonocardia hierapolitana]|uniref:Nucleotide-binding universal stress UspA family protein n=1 Tax=Pseudonocardia hierapolitana TaxID=1128676 RepID=A0A561SJU3_9PSEU|nr:universal stress protein [Pseudonocardia hierapolitana]TWF75158.1 nucleotide-binding universal stress UspA family protein [Pseudonocardia hierapolitana]
MDSPQIQHGRNDPLGVVVGVDGSRMGLDAVRWAVPEARLRGLPLQILHAAPYAAGSTAGTHRARDILARAFTVAHRADPALPVTTHHTERSAIPSLLDAAQRAQLLVVGMGGGERPEEVLIGSVALDVSGHSPCPVAVVRGWHHPPAGAPVLVGVDDPVTDAAALTVAFNDAHRHRGRVAVLHAGHGVPFGLDALARWTTRFPEVPVELTVVPGSPVPALLAAAVDARLVVLGTRARRAPARALFGSTSRAILRRSSVPVVVVNPGAARPGEPPVTVPAALRTSSADVREPHDLSQL